MPPLIALALCACFVTALLVVERRGNASVSPALWLPTCWFLIAGSRPIGRWFGIGGQTAADGSQWDRMLLSALMLLAAVVCIKRKLSWLHFLRTNVWVLVLFLYMGVSIVWTDYPSVSFKRWIRSAGPILMAAVILSEQRPLQAAGSILRRCAYILIPTSLILIKYFPNFGRAYGRWNGLEMWTGVTDHKNGLGQLCAVSVIYFVWSLVVRRRKSADTDHENRWVVWADMTVLAVAVYLLVGPGKGAFSATSISTVIVGSVVCVTLLMMRTWARPLTANSEFLVGGLALGYLAVGNVVTSAVSQILGRREDLTGRATEIWPLVLEAAALHPVLGTGYGGAWGLEVGLSRATGVDQAHSGYLDLYLELGFVGVVLFAMFIVSICGKVRREAKQQMEWAVFMLALLLVTLTYNLAESAFFDVYLASIIFLVTSVGGIGTEAARLQDPIAAARFAVGSVRVRARGRNRRPTAGTGVGARNVEPIRSPKSAEGSFETPVRRFRGRVVGARIGHQ
jgi:exopolysaccharide production protein ExoQ